MDDGTKFRYFNTGINTNGINVVNGNILTSSALQREFDKCVTLFKLFISSNKSSKENTLNISEINTDRESDGRNKHGGLGGSGRGQGRDQVKDGGCGGGGCSNDGNHCNNDKDRKRK